MYKHSMGISDQGILRSGAALVTSGLLLYLDASIPASYPGSGSSWFDLSGASRTVALTGGFSYITDNGGALRFNGSTGRGNFTMPSIASYQFNTGPGSTVMTICRPLVAKDQTIVSWAPRGNTLASQPTTQLVGAVTNVVAYTAIPNGLPNNQWASACNACEIGTLASGKGVRLYRNGVDGSSNSTTLTPSYGSPDAGYLAYINVGFGNEYFFNGDIAVVLIYGRVLTAAEAMQNFQYFRGRFGI